jgi:hypothetical protein
VQSELFRGLNPAIRPTHNFANPSPAIRSYQIVFSSRAASNSLALSCALRPTPHLKGRNHFSLNMGKEIPCKFLRCSKASR